MDDALRPIYDMGEFCFGIRRLRASDYVPTRRWEVRGDAIPLRTMRYVAVHLMTYASYAKSSFEGDGMWNTRSVLSKELLRRLWSKDDEMRNA